MAYIKAVKEKSTNNMYVKKSFVKSLTCKSGALFQYCLIVHVLSPSKKVSAFRILLSAANKGTNVWQLIAHPFLKIWLWAQPNLWNVFCALWRWSSAYASVVWSVLYGYSRTQSFFMWTAKMLIKLSGFTDWPESSHVVVLVFYSPSGAIS